MNQRLEGWKLAVAVLIPAAIIAAAIWFAIQALTDDGTSVNIADPDDDLVASQPTATEVPETDAVSDPTSVPTPTPLVLPEGQGITVPPTTEAEAAPTMTATPPPTEAPSNPAPTQPQPTGPAPTATPDPSVVLVTCSGGTFPANLSPGDSLPALSAAVSPPDRASSLRFTWNFGNGQVLSASTVGEVTYDDPGSYTVNLEAFDVVTGESVATTSCGSVTVSGAAAGEITDVACQVRPSSSSLDWAEASTSDLMRITTTWKPTDSPLTLQYEFGTHDPIIFSNDAVSGDSMTRLFSSRTDTVKVFWRNEATGSTGRIFCPAFTDPSAPTPTPDYASAALG